MLADSWIVFLRFHLFRMKLFVLQCCVVVAGSGARYELNFFTHSLILRRLNALSSSTHVGDDFVDADLIDGSHAAVRHTQANEALLGFEPESLVLQIWQKATTSSVFGVRNVVSALRALPSDLTYLGHDV